MNLTNKKEVDMLYAWASRNEDRSIFLSDQNENEDTFWLAREDEDSCIMPYNFNTLPDFEKFCANSLKKEIDKNIQRTVSVSAFKNSKSHEKIQQQKEKVIDKLPEHIYVF